MKIKGTPYGWWADNRIKKRLTKIKKDVFKISEHLPEELQDELSLRQIRHWSNLEAQLQLAALLAHPKSVVGNIFGGTSHTIISTGFQNWRRGRNVEWIRSNINPNIKTKEDIDRLVLKHGVIPEMLAHEFGLSKEIKQQGTQAFVKDLSSKFAKDPNMSKKTIMEIGSKYNIKEKVVEVAAKFMAVPERALRRDAFMAHYIKAWEMFNGAIQDPEHPMLIEMAKKGVKATQFLYNAPFRPAFARTSLGKVMTRFQVWAWNSVRFRNDILRQAKIHGYRPGTSQFDRFKRMAIIDLFVLGMANMYQYSIFDTALPAPYNWFQDTSEWLFGDEETRNRAFFGAWPSQVAPLQMVTPPILKLGPAALRAMVDDDWKRLALYHIPTSLPFGRLAKDLVLPGNVIENPINVGRKFFGIPIGELQRAASNRSKEIEEGTRFQVRTPGKGLF